MQRLLKNWKVIAYFVGFFALVLAGAESVGPFYASAGLIWLVCWIYANRSDFAGRKKAGCFDDDVADVSSTANGRWDPSHPMSPFNNSYFDHT